MKGGGHGHTRLRREGSSAHRAGFVMPRFQLASAGALGHGVSCSMSHGAALWGDRDRGDGDGRRGIGAGLRRARLNVPIVPPGREQEALASPWHLPGTVPAWGRGKGCAPLPRGVFWGGGGGK